MQIEIKHWNFRNFQNVSFISTCITSATVLQYLLGDRKWQHLVSVLPILRNNWLFLGKGMCSLPPSLPMFLVFPYYIAKSLHQITGTAVFRFLFLSLDRLPQSTAFNAGLRKKSRSEISWGKVVAFILWYSGIYSGIFYIYSWLLSAFIYSSLMIKMKHELF